MNGLLIGLLIGLTFGFTAVTVPAPPNIEGVLGIVGLWAGGAFALWVKAHLL